MTDPPNPAPGQLFDVTVTVMNQGYADAGPFFLRVHSERVPGSCTDYQGFFDFEYGLPSYWFQEIVFRDWQYGTAGAHTFGARVDACSEVAELNEYNNSLSETIQVTQPGQPDLIVQSISPSIASPAPGQSFTMNVTVRNQGTAAAGPFALLIDRDRASTPTLECSAEHFEYFNGLSVNGSETRSISVSYPTAGSHTFWARADGCPPPGVVESNENNNRLSRTIQVAAPDLIVESISPMPSFVLINRTHNLTARIRNVGTAWSNATIVHLFLNSTTAPTALCSGNLAQTVIALAPNGYADVSFGVSYASTGDKRLWIWADACGAIGELNENNNRRSAILPVRRGADLVIDSITPTSSPVRMLNTTSVEVVVRNAGDVATPSNQSISIRAILNSSDTPSNMCGSFDRSISTSSLAAGASRTVTIPNVTYALPGEHRFWAMVDPCDAIQESSGSNNRRSRVIDVHAPLF